MRIHIVVLIVSLVVTTGLPGQSPTARGPLNCAMVAEASDSGNGRIGAVSPGEGGRLAWADGVESTFLVRDSRGVLHRGGHSGEGPGEFRGLLDIGWIGDTLWVSDYRLPRVQLFSDTGTFLRTITTVLPAAWIPRPNGSLIGMQFSPASRISYTVTGYTPGHTSVDTIIDFPVPRTDEVMVPIGGRSIANRHPLLPTTVANWASDGSRWCAAIPRNGERFSLQCADTDGHTLLNQPIVFPLRPVTDAVYDSVIALFARAPGRTKDQMRGLISRPQHLPMVTELRLDDLGDTWLGRHHRSESQARYVRLRTDGSMRDSITIPMSYSLRHIRGDSVWAATTDDDGIQTLRRCSLR